MASTPIVPSSQSRNSAAARLPQIRNRLEAVLKVDGDEGEANVSSTARRQRKRITLDQEHQEALQGRLQLLRKALKVIGFFDKDMK